MSNLNPLEIVGGCRETQLHVGNNYSYLFNLTPSIFNYCFNMFKHTFFSTVIQSANKIDWYKVADRPFQIQGEYMSHSIKSKTAS